MKKQNIKGDLDPSVLSYTDRKGYGRAQARVKEGEDKGADSRMNQFMSFGKDFFKKQYNSFNSRSKESTSRQIKNCKQITFIKQLFSKSYACIINVT